MRDNCRPTLCETTAANNCETSADELARLCEAPADQHDVRQLPTTIATHLPTSLQYYVCRPTSCETTADEEATTAAAPERNREGSRVGGLPIHYETQLPTSIM